MDLDNLGQYLPMIGFIAVAAPVNYFLLWYKRKYDLKSWMDNLTADAARAAKDETYRTAELAAADVGLARYARPSPIEPVKRNQEVAMQTLPRFIWFLGLGATVVAFVGLFKPRREDGVNWELYVGIGLFAATGLLLLMAGKVRAAYGRVQLLNRKYLLLKAADVREAIPVLEEILEYYPAVPALRVEMADRLAKDGRLEDAVAETRKARESVPENADLKMIELTFQLRRNALAEAEELLRELRELPLQPSDPRREIFTADLALRRGDAVSAEKNFKLALELDDVFTTRFVGLDPTLQRLRDFAIESGLVEKEDEAG